MEHPKIYLQTRSCMDSKVLAWHLFVFHTSQPYSKLGHNTATRMCLRVLTSKANLCKTFCLLCIIKDLICLSHDPSLLNSTPSSRIANGIVTWIYLHDYVITGLLCQLFLAKQPGEKRQRCTARDEPCCEVKWNNTENKCCIVERDSLGQK